MPPKEKVQFAGSVSTEEAAQYLESLARGLRERTMLLESGDASLSVEVPNDVKIELEVGASPEKGKTSLDLSLSWRVVREPEAPPAPGLLIVAGQHNDAQPSYAE